MARRAAKPKPSSDPLKLPREWVPPVLTQWQREALEQGWFDFALPKFNWLLTTQAAQALHISPRAVLELAELGRIEVETIRITGQRRELRISRRSLLLHIASNRQLPPKEFAQMAVEFVRAIQCPQTLQLIRAAADQEISRH